MERGLDEIGSPKEAIVRVGSHHGPCAPPPWQIAASDLTFGNRFDDPRAAEGCPLAACFRCIYFGSTAEAAFGEVLASFQPPLSHLAKLAEVDDSETLDDVLAGILDFDETGRVRGIVPAEWLSTHLLCTMGLDPVLRFADLTTMQSRLYLRRAMASLAVQFGIRDLDFSTMLAPNQRRLTQACAAHIHELTDRRGRPRFAGIHYVSRHNIREWRCWALFDDRVQGRHQSSTIVPIDPNHRDLLRVARYIDLAIQTVAGTDQYIRP